MIECLAIIGGGVLAFIAFVVIAVIVGAIRARRERKWREHFENERRNARKLDTNLLAGPFWWLA